MENRALVRLGERTMLEYVIAALRGASCIDRIFVVGDVPESNGYFSVPSPGRQRLVQNLFAALMAVQEVSRSAPTKSSGQPALVVTSDIPFLTASAVEDFVEQALASEADFCYPIIPIAVCLAKFPQMQRTTLKVQEGTFTGGNLMLLNPAVVTEHRETILRAYAARKRPLQLGGMLGWGLLTRIAMAQTALPRPAPHSHIGSRGVAAAGVPGDSGRDRVRRDRDGCGQAG